MKENPNNCFLYGSIHFEPPKNILINCLNKKCPLRRDGTLPFKQSYASNSLENPLLLFEFEEEKARLQKRCPIKQQGKGEIR